MRPAEATLLTVLGLAAVCPPRAEAQGRTRVILSPVYEIDRKYRSMEGPNSTEKVTLWDGPETELLWITGVRTEMVGGGRGDPAAAGAHVPRQPGLRRGRPPRALRLAEEREHAPTHPLAGTALRPLPGGLRPAHPLQRADLAHHPGPQPQHREPAPARAPPRHRGVRARPRADLSPAAAVQRGDLRHGPAGQGLGDGRAQAGCYAPRRGRLPARPPRAERHGRQRPHRREGRDLDGPLGGAAGPAGHAHRRDRAAGPPLRHHAPSRGRPPAPLRRVARAGGRGERAHALPQRGARARAGRGPGIRRFVLEPRRHPAAPRRPVRAGGRLQQHQRRAAGLHGGAVPGPQGPGVPPAARGGARFRGGGVRPPTRSGCGRPRGTWSWSWTPPPRPAPWSSSRAW